MWHSSHLLHFSDSVYSRHQGVLLSLFQYSQHQSCAVNPNVQETNVVAWFMMNFTARDLSACETATGHLQLENAKLGEEANGRKKKKKSSKCRFGSKKPVVIFWKIKINNWSVFALAKKKNGLTLSLLFSPIYKLCLFLGAFTACAVRPRALHGSVVSSLCRRA